MVSEFGLICFIGITTLKDPMTQQCVERMEKELASTISQRNNQEMCFMVLEVDSNHLMGEG